MKELNFRSLNADEIECRVAMCNKGGVTLLLYKDARVDMKLLDESVGPMNWQRSHTRDNANCIISIWDDEKNQWVSKEDTGVESFTEKEKGLASDSFKRAGFNWGIGRELYTAPNIFIPKEKLKHFSDEGGKYKCYDTFKVADIAYDENKNIASVTIAICEWGKEVDKVTFKNATSSTKTTAPAKSVEAPKTTATAATSVSKPETPISDTAISDDEVILIGNCRGKKYGEVKGTPIFTAFLKWVKSSGANYPEAEKNAQLEKFKKIAG